MTDDRPPSILDALADHPELKARFESLSSFALGQLGKDWKESGDKWVSVALPVLRHRVLLNYHAEAEGETPDSVSTRLLQEVSPPGSSPRT